MCPLQSPWVPLSLTYSFMGPSLLLLNQSLPISPVLGADKMSIDQLAWGSREGGQMLEQAGAVQRAELPKTAFWQLLLQLLERRANESTGDVGVSFLRPGSDLLP